MPICVCYFIFSSLLLFLFFLRRGRKGGKKLAWYLFEWASAFFFFFSFLFCSGRKHMKGSRGDPGKGGSGTARMGAEFSFIFFFLIFFNHY